MDYHITAAENGKEIKAVLCGHGVSTTLLRRLKRLPLGITLDGRHATVREKVAEGQLLHIESADLSPSADIVPVSGRLDVLFEDGYILIVNKPFGMPVHPSRGHFTDTLANIAAYHFAQKGETCVFRAVNRLDSGTGGLLCIAKDALSARKLGENLAGKQIKRVYEAVVCGTVPEDRGTVDRPIGLCDGCGIKRCVRPDGERAVTHWRVLARNNGRTRVEVELETGRTHQIRVHFADMGCPVWGDFMYGTETDFHGHALFSKTLALTHPVTGEKLVFSAAPPDFFDELMN